jgi:E3 ubiquitin-protein ligase HUWE1
MSLDDSPRLDAEQLPDLIERIPTVPDESREAPIGEEQDVRADTAGTGQAEPAKDAAKSTFVATKESLDQQRAELGQNLIDRCLDVIRTHPDSAIEVSELINAMILRQQNPDGQTEVCETLTFAISSLALDETEKKQNGKCIASYAHLLALLLQDEGFFQQNLDTLRDKIEEYVNFLKVPNSVPADELPSWIPYILLVLELVLRHDERPVAAQWKAPKSLDEEIAQPIINLPVPLANDSQRRLLLDSVLDLLPRVGKEEVLATSILRVLVILTRNRRQAKYVGDKKNLQRLFLMAKQLAGFGAERLKQSKITANIVTILRHVVEDEDVIKQVMRAEIKADFTNISRGQRGHPDVVSYLRHTAALAVRAPDLFVEISNEMIEFHKWSPPTGEHTRPPSLCLKDDSKHKTESVEEPSAIDVKESTEPADKDMGDAHRQAQDSKRPLVENPDGVVHFLLCELINYREVDDKEQASAGKDGLEIESTDPNSPDSSTQDAPTEEPKDKKPVKPVFKTDEHPIFVYRCFLLNCLAELLQSYNRTKVEFINFKRSAPPLPTTTPVKPRSSVLNYLIYDLLCQGNLSGTHENIASKKKAATSAHTQKLLVALVAKTKERPVDRTLPRYAWDDEPELVFVRKFVLDTILKAYERAPISDEPLETRYSRMQSLAELMNSMIGERLKEHGSSTRSSDSTQSRSQAQLRRMMYEKGYLDKLTSSIAEISLNYPGVKRAIKYILRVLRVLTDTAKELSHANLLPNNATEDSGDDEISSTSSLSDLDDREETPDLYRNSSLGMLEPRDDVDESDEEDEDGDELYGDEYDDEMDYDEEGLSDDDQDNISEDSEMGEIEGLPGEPEVVEVIMDEDDDGDEDDSEDDDDEEDDDDLDSDDMEDVEDRVEIEVDGHSLDDDGNLEWETDSDAAEEDELDGEDIDYEAEAQNADEAHVHAMGQGGLLSNMARALMEGEDYDPDLMDDHYLDEGHDDDGRFFLAFAFHHSCLIKKQTKKMRKRKSRMRSISTMMTILVSSMNTSFRFRANKNYRR